MSSRNYFLQVTIAVDQLLNTLLAGFADETLSSRAYRCQNEKRRWKIARVVIDAVFFWEEDHCRMAYFTELARGHFPAEYRT